MTKYLSTGLVIAGTTFAGSASAVLIDNFDEGADAVFEQGFATSLGPSNTAAAGIIGGSRTLAITSAPAPTVTLAADSNPNFDQLSLANGPGATSSSSVTWDANGAGLGGEDLILAGIENNDALQLDIISIDQGLVTLTVTIEDVMNNISELVLSGLGAGQQAFDFANFTAVTTTAADFTNVDSIILNIDAGDASDLRLDLIQTRQGPVPPTPGVPVPGTVLLMGAALAATGLRRKAK